MPHDTGAPLVIKLKPKPSRSKWLDRLISIAVSLALALLAWLYASNRDQEVLEISVPVEITLNPIQSENYLLEILGPKQATVSFTGTPRKIRETRDLLQSQKIVALVEYSIADGRLNEPKFSDTLLVSEENMKISRGIHVRMIEGKNRIPLTVHKMVEKNLPVLVEKGGLASTQILAEPASVTVKGPQEILERAKGIPTVPWAVPVRLASQGNYSNDFKLMIVRELEGKPIIVKPDHVTVKAPPETRKVYEIKEIPIRFLLPADFPLKPLFQNDRSSKVDLRVEGPVLPHPPRILAFIDLGEHPGVVGVLVEKVQIHLPKDFFLVEEFSRDRTIELTLPGNGGNAPQGLPKKP